MILIDAHALIFQVFHAIRDPMTSASGLPTNALFGFTRDMLYLRSRKPAYLVCAFDVSEVTFRNEIFPAYKAHRDPMPADLAVQLPLIHKVLSALSIPVVGHPRYEADDLLATLATAGAARGLDVWICTSDKDCRQLINDRVKLYNLRKREEFGRQELLDDWGIRPDQVVDLQTLTGDAVDGVPGVPGVGVKTAAKLLNQYDTLENLLAHVEEISGPKTRENIKNASKLFDRGRILVRLVTDVPVPLTWDAWPLQPIKMDEAVKLFQEYGFQSLLGRLRETAPGDDTQGDLFSGAELFPFGANAPAGAAGDDNLPPPSEWKADYRLIDTPEAFERFFSKLNVQKRFAFDTETTGLDPLQSKLVGLSFSWKAGEAYYLPVRAPKGEPHLDLRTTLKKLTPLLENPAVEKVNQNIKYDLLVLRANGVEVAGVAGDSMVADYLLHAGERTHGIDDLTLRYFKHQKIKTTELIGEKKKSQITMDQVPTRRVADYAGEDADAAWRLCELLEPQLESLSREPGVPSLRQLYQDVEVPLIDVLASMEYHGIRLDAPFLQKLSVEMGKQLADIEEEIYRLAGHPFNIGSLPQLRKVLFDELKLPKQKTTNTTGAASTDQETLEKLATLTHLKGHELPRKILDYRQVSKLKSTYVDALPEMVNPNTGRVHASFNQTIAATGRLSCADPNLQNIPVRREMGAQIRQAFLPESGWKLLTADYSQIELRLLAHFCNDATLRQAFAEDRDVHAAVAAQINNVADEQVTDEMRRLAKTVNFGVLYGMSPMGLAERLHIPREQAVQFIDSYFKRYPAVLEYQQTLLENCRKSGFVSTILGRRRHIDGIRANSTYQQRSQPEREAINMEIQGSAADLIKLAMLHVHRRLQRDRLHSRLLLQIHDELVFEAPPEELATLAELVRTEMTTPLEKSMRLRVPLKVDMATGPNWLDVEEWQE